MSYLLKALEKAEQERKQLNPEASKAQVAVVTSQGLPASIIIVLLSLTAILIWQVVVSQSSVSDKAQTEISEQQGVIKPKEVSAVESVSVVPVKNAPIETLDSKKEDLSGFELIEPNKDSLGADVSEVAASEIPVNELPVSAAPLQLEQLSKGMLDLIPSLQLESHIFSSAEDFRSVVINGRTFKQGQFINPDVILDQITEDGIVIDVASQLIALPKGITWVASQNAQ